MAKLRFGSGLELKVEEPSVAQEQVVAPAAPQVNMEELLSSVMASISLPKPEQQPSVDLGPIENAIQNQAERLIEHNERLEKLERQEKPSCKCTPVALPEIKHITHVKDVSADVMEHVVAQKQELKGDLMTHANHIVKIEAQLKSQRLFNLVLSGIVLLTIILHFI